MNRIYRILTVTFQKHSPSLSELNAALGLGSPQSW